MLHQDEPGCTTHHLGRSRALRAGRKSSYQQLQGRVPLRMAQKEVRRLLLTALRSARRGSAGGLSGTRAEHLKVLLEDDATCGLFADLADAFANAQVPEAIAAGLALGRMAALSKAGGRVRGIVTGATFRRLVGRTLAK